MIFFSHSNEDRSLCDSFIARLKAADVTSLFVDFDPVDGIPPGRKWEEEIYVGLKSADAYLAIDTPNWRQSKWAFAEVSMARALCKPVIVLRLFDAPATFGGTAELARDHEYLQLPEKSPAQSLAPLLLELKRLGVVANRPRWDPSRVPYPGLTPLDESDAGVFFGRDEAVRQVVDTAELCIRYGEKIALLLIGHSGSGKSSLLRAGVLPQLRQKQWRIFGPVIATATTRLPLAEIRDLPKDVRALVALDQMEEALSAEVSPELLADFATLSAPDYKGRVLIIGTLRGDSLRQLNERLGSVARKTEHCFVGPLTASDYHAIIEKPAAAAGITVEPQLITKLTADLAASDSLPVAVAGSEPALSADALPMLAVTLRRMWDRRSSRTQLSYSDYTSLGRLDGIIARTADEIVASSVLDDADQAALRDAFIGMVQIGHDGRFSRRMFDLSSQSVRVSELLRRFADEGLLVTGDDAGHVQLAHEALIRTWPKLKAWVDEARTELIAIQRFEQSVRRWSENKAALLEGIDLMEAEALQKNGRRVALTPEASELIELSVAKYQEAHNLEERERQARISEQQARRVADSLRLAGDARQAMQVEPETAMCVAWEAVLRHRNEYSESVFRDCLARLPAPVRILHSGARVRQLGFGSNDSFIYLLAADKDLLIVQRRGRDSNRSEIPLPKNQLHAVASVPGEPLLVLAGNGQLRVLDVSGRDLSVLDLPDWARGRRADETPPRIRIDESGVAAVQQGSRAWLLDVSVGCRLLRVIKLAADQHEEVPDETLIHPYYFTIVGLDLDARLQRLLTYCTDGTAICWSFDGKGILKLTAGRSEFADARFLGSKFVTGLLSGRGEIWDEAGHVETKFRPDAGGHDLFIKDVSRTGEYFITSANGPRHELEVWSSSGELLALLATHQQHYWDAVFSPDEQLVAGGCADGMVRIWNWRTQMLLAELPGYTNTVSTVRFSTDGRSLLSASFDDSVRLWSPIVPLLPDLLEYRGPIARAIRRGADFLTSSRSEAKTIWWRDNGASVVLPGKLLECPDGPAATSIVATLDGGQQIHIWKLSADPERRAKLLSVDIQGLDSINPLCAWASPDSSRIIVAVLRSPTIWPRLLSVQGAPLADLITTSARRNANDLEGWRYLTAAAFHPDSRQVLTAIRDGTVCIWSAADGQLQHTFIVDEGSPDALLSLAVDPRGEFVVTGIRNQARIWGWNGQSLGSVNTSGYKVGHVVFSPDGGYLVTISDNPAGNPMNLAQLWSRAGERLATLDIPTVRSQPQILFDRHDSRCMLIESAEDARIFDMHGQLVSVLAGSRGAGVRSSAVSPKGTHFAALFSDGMIRVWDVESQQRSMSIRVGGSGQMLFSNDGGRLIVAKEAGGIEQIEMDIAKLYPAAAARLGRGLSANEARRFEVDPIQLDISRHR